MQGEFWIFAGIKNLFHVLSLHYFFFKLYLIYPLLLMNYRRAVELVRTSGKAAKIPDVKEVITRMQSSLTAAYLGDCSLHERIMLASLIKCILRSGVLEVPWDEVRKNSLSPSLHPLLPFVLYFFLRFFI